MSGGSASDTMDKYLSRVDVWALSLGCIIGWGAFVMPGTTFLPVAGPGGTVLAMVISTAVTLVIGHNYFALMKRYPGTGGVYYYTKELYGRDHAFLSSWFLCLAYVSLIPQNATVLALICRTLTGDALRWGIHYQVAGTEVYLAEVGIAVAALVLIGLFAICMKPFLQGVQTMLGIVLVVGIVLVAVLITPHVRLQDLLDVCGTMSGSPLRGVLSIVILAPWAFVGFEVVSLETAHFNFPVRRSGKLVLLAIVIGGFIYIIMAITAIVTRPEAYVGWQDYVQDLGSLDGIDAIPTFYVLQSMLGTPGVALIAVTAFAAVITSIIGFYRASARLLMNMAADHILAKSFNRPPVCFLFLMGLSAFISLFGSTALAWVVNLSSLGAIVGFGYASAAVRRAARREGSRRDAAFGTAGLVLAAAFACVQLIPGISLIETMGAESYLLLAAWCLIGFAFYWRTMRMGAGDELRNESVSIAALVFLLIFSIAVWYAKCMTAAMPATAQVSAFAYSVVLLAFILLGLAVMLRIHSRLRKQRMEAETERIRALESSQAKSRFLFNMSHDIRTPMNAIVGYANLALREPLAPEVRDYLEKIDLSSQHMLALINDILEMSRIESGKVELSEAPADLRAVFRELQLLFAEQMKQKGIGFSVDAGGVRDPYVHCDRKSLNRVLLNLVSNAYKFTPEGGTVAVSVEQGAWDEAGSDARASYRISVKDSGIGMSEEFAERMFSAFERERTSTDSGVEGAGLGLAITKSLVDLMGGTIEVHTATGQGTEMVVSLPLQLARRDELPEQGADAAASGDAEGAGAADAGAAGAGATDAGAAPVDYSEKRLLLVDDNAINREIATMILAQAGFMVEVAEDGQIAVEKVVAMEPGYYDAVLMDIQMPVMNGYAATRAIRALDDPSKRCIPIVAMTANAFKEDEDAAFEAGMQAHVAKPIDVGVLLSTLDRVLRAE